MEKLLYLLPLLACPIGMLLMMWLMGKGMGRKSPDTEAPSESPRSVEALRADQERLAAEIEQLEHRNGAQAVASDHL